MDREEGVPFDTDFMESGWMRWLPHSALMVHMAMLDVHLRDVEGDLDALAEDERFASVTRGLEHHVWDPPHVLDPTDPEDIEELKHHREWVDRVNSIATDNGLPPIRTNRDLVELMRRLGLIERVHDGDAIHWRPVTPLPLPDERIKLTDEERALEDRIRWRGLHERNAQSIIKIFVEGEQSVLTTTIESLAGHLEITAEDAREAVLCLMEDADFSSPSDLTSVGVAEPFDLRVDWDVFSQTRIGIRFADPGE